MRSTPAQCADGQQNGNEDGIDCGGQCPTRCIIEAGEACLEHGPCVTGVCQAGTCEYAKQCSDIQEYNPLAPSGVYQIDPDGGGSFTPVSAYCDMVTDGGGWTLILNYLHEGGSNPELSVLDSGFPLLYSSVLGDDESGSLNWGHVSNNLFGLLNATQARFYGRSSIHARIIDFNLWAPECMDYFADGGSAQLCNDESLDKWEPLLFHNARIPDECSVAGGGPGHLGFIDDNATMAMAEFGAETNSGPSFWHIRTLDTNWRVDDGSDSSYDTLHRVFVRTREVCNGVDDDGDLLIDEIDLDQDGYSPCEYHNFDDCCDSDPNANPDGDFRTLANNCGEWDWNCDETVEKWSTQIWSYNPCQDGWDGSVPDCGASGAWVVMYFDPWFGDCFPWHVTTITQSCR
ncbi:MAG: hypothetical protein JRJ19_00625 [Deltaproteobacteria bacterium]|nr:hypothetical protein [Deltaproteobacteria bacterium]